MEKNINEFVFGRTKAEKKISVIDTLSDDEIRKTAESTILRIFKECKGKDAEGNPRDKFYISNKRAAGNNWNSTIEFIHEYNGRACIEFYVQNTKTDWGESVEYNTFNRATEYCGRCSYLGTTFRYNSKDIANVIRCILKEYIYYKYIEREERERREKIEKVLHWKIYNPVANQFYKEWRCRFESGGCFSSTPNTDRYHRAEKAVKEYVAEHIEELYGKTAEELQEIYKGIFRETK
jgi:hypothetical protein